MSLMELNHLPQCQAKHASLQHAVKFKLCADGLLSVPRSAVVDGVIGYGGSTGIGLDLPRKAYGEFYERNHFFTSVPIHTQKPLAHIYPEMHRKKLMSLLRGVNEKLFEHLFSLTTVYNLFDETPHDYFFNAISLNGNKNDASYLNFSDSCACASHPNKQNAIYCSLAEFLERQALLGSWLSKTYRYAINPEVLKSVTPYSTLAEKLLENGDVYIFENNNYLPGYSLILFYFAHSEKDIVQYSVGAKSGLSLAKTLTAALEELYQCYTFLYNAESTNTQLERKAGSGYHVAFQRYNTQATRAVIPFLAAQPPFKINTAKEVWSSKVFNYQEIRAGLAQLSQDIFYYHHYEPALNLHFTKVMSPDFFAHMSLTNPLNFSNDYARMLGIKKETAYLVPLPFP